MTSTIALRIAAAVVLLAWWVLRRLIMLAVVAALVIAAGVWATHPGVQHHARSTVTRQLHRLQRQARRDATGVARRAERSTH